MANLTELSQWESGIYQLETTDSVEAGAGGISNEQARLLGNRTKWLYDKLLKSIPQNSGYITGVDINTHTVGHNYSVSGDFTAAIITQDLLMSEVIRITMDNDMGNTNYKVLPPAIQSLGTFDTDNSLLPILFKPISGTQFDVILEETANATQNLRLHFDVISLD